MKGSPSSSMTISSGCSNRCARGAACSPSKASRSPTAQVSLSPTAVDVIDESRGSPRRHWRTLCIFAVFNPVLFCFALASSTSRNRVAFWSDGVFTAAPCSRRIATTLKCPFKAAHLRGVDPEGVVMLTSAFRASRALTAETWPFAAATCKAVRPKAFAQFMSAPASSNLVTTYEFPFRAASCSGEFPATSWVLKFAPRSSKTLTTSRFPRLAATCKAVSLALSSGTRQLGFAPFPTRNMNMSALPAFIAFRSRLSHIF
mmetsp:Transcript_10784/g.16936  ORF Transcript_10784/g.16936 Transcript_10784/m.16936 type:complete len:259 (-) Transcript_10784:97-873(-)